VDYPKSVPSVGLVNGKFVDEDTATGVVGSLIPSAWGNAVTDELINVIKAAQFAPDEAIKTQLADAIRTIAGALVGGARGVKMSVSAASATASLTADEVTVKSALGGQAWLLANFNKAVDLSKVGAGGMDTGVAPANGFVALYAIYNPTTGVSALLAVNATPVKATEVYGGVNMPAGFTASALVSVWGTAASQFKIGSQVDRRVDTANANALNSATPNTTTTALSIASFVPLNAKLARISWSVAQGASASGVSLVVGSSATGLGAIGTAAASTSGTSQSSISAEIQMVTAQTVYYNNSSAAAVTNTIAVMGYYF
jgi:hypothetical protein